MVSVPVFGGFYSQTLNSRVIFIINIGLQPHVPGAWYFICFSFFRSGQFAVSFPRAGVGWLAQGLEQRRVWVQEGTPQDWESPTQHHHCCVCGRCLHKPSTAAVFLPPFPSSPAGSAGSDGADWYPALLQPLLVVIQSFGCFIEGFASKVNINHTVGRLSRSASLPLFSVHDKTMWKGSTQAKGRVRRNKIPYLKHA